MTRETFVDARTGRTWQTGEPTAEELLAEWRAGASVSRFQIKAALAGAERLEAVNAFVATRDVVTQIAWAEVETWPRLNATLVEILEGAGIAPEEIDALFTAAADITT